MFLDFTTVCGKTTENGVTLLYAPRNRNPTNTLTMYHTGKIEHSGQMCVVRHRVTHEPTPDVKERYIL